MKVKSTGLGKTQLTAHFDGFTAKEGGEPSAVLIITSTEPVHWHIECDLGGSDLRQFAGQVLRPSMIWHLVKLLVRGGDARGFVMEKEGGRRSGKERVSRAGAAAPAAAATATETVEPVAATTETAPKPATSQVAAAANPTTKPELPESAPAPRPAAPAVAAGHTESPAAFTEAATPDLLAAVTAAAAARAAAPQSAGPAPADDGAGQPESSGTSDREERERRRAERRRQREEAAEQYATAG